MTDDIEWARALIAESLVWDAHAGIFPTPDADLSNVGDWRAAGVDYVSINIGFDVLDWTESMATLSAYRRKLGAMAGAVSLIRTLDDIHAARAAGKLAVSFDIEGVNALNGDLGMISVYADLGVRQMLLAYNLGNAASGGCHDADTGLTPFGREVVAEMNRVGMILDLSHMSGRSSLEATELSARPAVFTHSNPRRLWDHERNISDEQIRACAAAGGVIGVNGMGIFLGANDISPETFADHVSAIADLTGPQHVAFGLDWKPRMAAAPDLGAILRSRPDYWPAGQQYDTPGIRIFSPAELPEVVCILRDRGWRDGDLKGFLGENIARVAAQTWPGDPRHTVN